MSRAAGRPATGTILVPAFRRVHRCHPGPDRTSRSGAVPGNAWTHTHTHRQTDKHQPPNFFSPTHRRKSSFIRTCYAKALAPFILYDFGLPFPFGFEQRLFLESTYGISFRTSPSIYLSTHSAIHYFMKLLSNGSSFIMIAIPPPPRRQLHSESATRVCSSKTL